MAGTQTISSRNSLVVDGSNKYEIVTTCTVAGTLPDTGIFLLNIITTVDPKDDTLLRVIEIADIAEFSTIRDDAITKGQAAWRASSLTLLFDDIETANAAWKELESRITALVKQIDAFNDEFETAPGGTVTVYPAVDLSEKNALISAYQDTLQPIVDAEAARNTGQLACTQLTADLNITEERLQEAQADLTLFLQIQAEVGNVNTALPTIRGSIATANAQARAEVTTSAASASEKLSIEVQHSAIDAQITLFNTHTAALNTTQTGPIASTVATLQNRVSTLITEKSTLSTQIIVCNNNVATLQATVNAARAVRETALANVLDVCPDFTP
jgi:chromosome segregation ATPase